MAIKRGLKPLSFQKYVLYGQKILMNRLLVKKEARSQEPTQKGRAAAFGSIRGTGTRAGYSERANAAGIVP